MSNGREEGLPKSQWRNVCSGGKESMRRGGQERTPTIGILLSGEWGLVVWGMREDEEKNAPSFVKV